MTKLYLFLIALAVQLISAYLGYQYLVHWGEEGLRFKSFFYPAFKKKLFVFTISGLLLSVGVFCYGFFPKEEAVLRALINAEMCQWLLLIGYIDLKEKIIPNSMILVGLIFWVLVVLVNIFVGKVPAKDILMFSIVGAGISFILLIIALIVKSALGMGDVKMFLVIGLLYGLVDTYSILLFSVIVMAIVSIILLLIKKATRKTAIPMAPFTAIGFLLSILAGL